MARRRYGRRRRGRSSFKIPLVSLAILGGQAAIAHAAGGDVLNQLHRFQMMYSGIDFYQRKFVPQELVVGYGPWLVKGLIRKVARPLGALPKIPLGLPISVS